MTQQQVIALIQQWIVANGNEEITADVLRPILEAMVNQPNDLIGDLNGLTTTNKDSVVDAINEVNNLSNGGITIHYGSDTPFITPPVSFELGDFYAQLDGSSVLGFWQYNGVDWVLISQDSAKPLFDYEDINEMLTNQASQTNQKIYIVDDASGDNNLEFKPGETKLQAAYRFKGDENGSIDDYTLISAPYAIGGGGSIPTLQEVTDEGNTTDNPIEFLTPPGYTNGKTKITHISVDIDSELGFKTFLEPQKLRFELDSASYKNTDYGFDSITIVDIPFSGSPKGGELLFPDLGDPNNIATLATEEWVNANVGGVPKEEEITGTRLTNASVTGSTPLDWDAYKVFEFTLTGATTLTDTNLPTGTETKVIELVISGNQVLTLPVYWEALPSNDAYDGTVRNHLVVSCIDGDTNDIIYSLQNLSS